MTVKVGSRPVAQGDILIIPVKPNTMPEGFAKVPDVAEGHVVAHSETGHHHVLRAAMAPFDMSGAMEGGGGFGSRSAAIMPSLFRPTTGDRELRGFVHVPDGGTAEIVHKRDYHTHGTIELPAGDYMIMRQQIPTPSGWRKQVD